ncbi:MAG: hypothetical protein KDB55_18635 [Mycobacterium sp.]|nr:hypothetical protein [Mycobacterium sp.]
MPTPFEIDRGDPPTSRIPPGSPVELADHLTGHFVVPSRPLRSYLMCDHFAGGEEGTMRWSISLSSASFVLINPHTGAHVAQRNR